MSIQIPKKKITNENIERMEKSLMIVKDIPKNKNRQNFYYEPPKIPFFRSHLSYLMVPFFWGKSYFGKKYLSSSSLTNFTFQGQLREEQKKLEIETLDFLHEHNSCLVAVYPGGGKTITSLSILSKLKKKH